MGRLFSRGSFAEFMGVSKQRISQLEQDGTIAEPAPEYAPDGRGVGWPESYVEAAAATRAGSQASPSIFGLAPSLEPWDRTKNTVVEYQCRLRTESVHVQVFTQQGADLVFLTPLSREYERPWPNLAPSSTGQYARDLEQVEWIRCIAAVTDELFDGNPFAQYWLSTSSRWNKEGFSEIIVKSFGPAGPSPYQHDYPFDIIVSNIAPETVISKIGQELPILPRVARTIRAFEAWAKAGFVDGTPYAVDMGFEDMRACSAAVVHSLNRGDDQTRTILVDSLTRHLQWQDSATEIAETLKEHYRVAGTKEVLQLRYPDFARWLPAEIRDRANPKTATSFETLVAAIDWAQSEIDLQFSTYGATPDNRVVAALETAISAAQSNIRTQDYHQGRKTPRHHDIFPGWTVRETPGKKMPNDYFSTLSEVPPRDRDTPQFRNLADKTGANNARLTFYKDSSGIEVLRLRSAHPDLPDFEGHGLYRFAARFTKTSPLNDFANYESILVANDTQLGPLWVFTNGVVKLMPFAYTKPGRFTYGYSGSGPAQLEGAITGFIEWAHEKTLNENGRRLLEAIIESSTDNDFLVIRRQDFLPAHFDLETTASTD